MKTFLALLLTAASALGAGVKINQYSTNVPGSDVQGSCLISNISASGQFDLSVVSGGVQPVLNARPAGLSPLITLGAGNQIVNTSGPGVRGVVVLGGFGNTVSSGNSANASYSVIAGGFGNLLRGSQYGVVGSGLGNTLGGAEAGVMAGGYWNVASNSYCVVSGGRENTNSSYGGVIGGGASNRIYGPISGTPMVYNAIGGGFGNVITNVFALSQIGGITISGGELNLAGNDNAVISGGAVNTVTGNSGVISGGNFNTVSGGSGIIAGGNWNTASGVFSAIGGGYTNQVSGDYGTIPGGRSNIVSGQLAGAYGNAINATENGAQYVGYGDNALVVSSNGNAKVVGTLTVGGKVQPNLGSLKAGTTAIASLATSTAVTFATAVGSANYAIVLTPAGFASSPAAMYSSKASGGFTINTLAVSGGGSVDWVVIPYNNP